MDNGMDMDRHGWTCMAWMDLVWTWGGHGWTCMDTGGRARAGMGGHGTRVDTKNTDLRDLLWLDCGPAPQ